MERLHRAVTAPSREFSPVATWWWSGEPLERARLRYQLERFAEGGVFNLVVLNLAPSGPMFGADPDSPSFFSPAWWELFDQVCDDAAALGVSLWFYDQLGFSGAELQARLVRDVPEYAGQWLAADGTITTRGFDYLSEEACAALLDRVHGEYERNLGHRLGSVIVGSFQDELPSVPTWSRAFAAEFILRHGYPLPLGEEWSPQVRHDYHRTRADLAEAAFFRPLADWHAKHGLLSGCDQQDPARAGHPADGVRLYADYARTHRWYSAPGSDHHGDARIHSSLAHLYDRPRTWVESFHSSGWGGTIEETFDWLLPWLRSGATLYNPHAVYYSTKAGWFEWAPPSTDWRQPYWAHYKVFADAVSRLCGALSLGRHLCDVAVLFPTATAQAFSGLDGPLPEAVRAQEVYRGLVGDMAWFQTRPGSLDRLCLDADVIDDDSVQRAEVSGARLRVADEAYAAVILPACLALEAQTATRLLDFAAAGGLLIAYDHPPALTLGTAAADGPAARAGTPSTAGETGAAVADGLAARVGTSSAFGETGVADGLAARVAKACRVVSSQEELAALLGGLRRVEAPVPTLLREVDGTPLLFVPGTAPMASRVSVERPELRGAELGWLDVTYDFDPGRYQRDMRVRVREVTGAPVLLGVFGGEPRPLPYVRDGADVEFTIPFDDGPAALIAFPADAAEPAALTGSAAPVVVNGPWEMELVPTLDDAWGDFGTVAAVECWEFEHRVDGEPDWRPAYATVGPHGRIGGEPAVYSRSRGIRKDPIHREFLGPKGHVPEEFLDFGTVAAGQEVTFRTVLTAEAGFLAVGAAAAKTARLDGAEIALDDHGYLAIGVERVPAGRHLLELRLVPEETLPLRAHLAVVTDPAAYLRPEWITSPAPVRVDAGELQVSAYGTCRVLVDGVEIGRQGGFLPYAEIGWPKTGRYTVPAGLLELDLAEGGAVLVDGVGISGHTMTGQVRRRQYGDPAALHLRRRPHPLPDSAWLERPRPGSAPAGHADPGPSVAATTFADPEVGPRVEWLRFTVPPGTTRVELTVHGPAELYVDDREVARGEGELAADLEAGLGARQAVLRVSTRPGRNAGAALGGPVRFQVGRGPVELGDWERVGLRGYSGGVRYRTSLTGAGPAVLDLGEVRGTAEVFVDGVSAGVRVCSPYRFPVTLPGEVEVVVYGTLGPYIDAISPTHFVFEGQRRSGMFGPVRVICQE